MSRKFCVALIGVALAVPAAASADPVVVDRDEFSTTTRLDSGKLKTSVSSQPVNFRDGGEWKAIDTELEPVAGGALSPAAVDGDLVIPSSLAQPIELEHDGREVSIRLRGSSATRDGVEDAGVEFGDALAGVDAAYESTVRGVKETLKLASASATKVFSYDVRAGAAWSASVDGRGEVVLKDGGGVERYRITAPLAWDSAADPAYTNALVLSVDKVADGRWTVTLRPDAGWLSDPARSYPVFIDPDFSWSNGTTHFHGAQDCYLSGNTQANNTFCAQTYLQTGYYNRPYKSIFKFDIASAIPTNATVSSAVFKAYAPPASARASGNHRLHTITSDWDSTATWNNRKTGTPWTTAGGDISVNPDHTSAAPTAVQALSTWFTFPAPLATVQGWVNGTLPNYGFLLKTDAGAPATQAYAWASTEASTSSSFPATPNEWPTLDVTWSAPSVEPTLSVSGAFVQGASQPLPADSALKADFHATSPLDGIASVSVAIDGADGLHDLVENEGCESDCALLDGQLDMALAEVEPGSHTALFKVTDSEGREATQTVAFTRSDDPSLADQVDDWAGDYAAAVGTSASGVSGLMPAPPAAVRAEGDCEAAPNSPDCRKASADWAADVQDWLSTAQNPEAIPDLPAFPVTEPDGDLDEATAATAGMLRLAELVAKAPGDAQAVGVTFDEPVDDVGALSWVSSKTVPSPVAITGAAGTGGWKQVQQSAETPTLSTTLSEYYASLEAKAVETVVEIEEEIADDPSEPELVTNLQDAETFLAEVRARAALIQGLSVTLSGPNAATALRQSAHPAAGVTITAPLMSTQGGTIEAQAAAPSQPVALRSSARRDNCAARGDAGVIPTSMHYAVSPVYWAPERLTADSMLATDTGISSKYGWKRHKIRARWTRGHSLAWMCAGEPDRRGVELEARVKPSKHKWSDGWPYLAQIDEGDDTYKKNWTAFTNLPGDLHLDDIARGNEDQPDVYVGKWPYDKGMYPDFAIVFETGRAVQYQTLYKVDFITNGGNTGSSTSKGMVIYSAQATSWATEDVPNSLIDEKGYCLSKFRQHASCMFADSTVCYGRHSLQFPIAKYRGQWRERLKYGDNIVPRAYPQNSTRAFPNWDGMQATDPCVAKEELSTKEIAPVTEEETGFPIPLTEPELQGCETLTAACVVDSGTWDAGITLAYADGYCEYEACPEPSPTPNITWSREIRGGCTVRRAQITVVATRTPSGQASTTGYYALEGPEVVDCLAHSCNSSDPIAPDPGSFVATRTSWGADASPTAKLLAKPDGTWSEIADPELEGKSFSWAPDRKRVLWLEGNELLAKPINGNTSAEHLATITLPTYGADSASCSPNGRYVALASADGVYVHDLVAQTTERVAEHANINGTISEVSWSPDNSAIAYSFGDAFFGGTEADIFVVNYDGSSFRNITLLFGGSFFSPHWTPDGQSLVYYYSDFNDPEYAQGSLVPWAKGFVAMRSVATGVQKRLSATAARRTQYLTVSPDVSRAAYTRSNMQQVWGGGIPDWGRGSDVFTIDLFTGAESRRFEGTTERSYNAESWGTTVIPDSQWTPPTGFSAK